MSFLIDLDAAMREHDHKKVYEIMEDPDFDINQIGRCDWSPLFLALKLQDEKYVEVFLKMGANPNWCLGANENPSLLHYAVHIKAPIRILELLVQYGARESFNSIHETALHEAAKQGNAAAVTLFLRRGFDPNIKSGLTNKSPIDYAEAMGHHQLAKTMRNPLSFLLIQMKYNLPVEIINYIKSYTFVGQIEKHGRDQIKTATKNDDIKALDALLKNNYLLYSNDVIGMPTPPLNQAVLNNNYKMAELLIKHSAIITKSDCASLSPYECAEGNPEIQKLLLDTKRNQLEIFKQEFGLEDKNPQICQLR